jgi:predicted 3-demethylubiquinone-9 3-methyltransferase (glyoxalase superfamily)
MPTIAPHLWFNTQAKEAAEFYVAALGEGSRVTHVTTLRDTPSGDCDVVSYELAGQPFMAISAGPLFSFNPSISFFVNFHPTQDADPVQRIDALWAALADGGTPLMPLDRYPFSDRFGWIQDRYGVSWQLRLASAESEPRPRIMPSLMFTGAVAGKAEEAIDLYTSVFGRSGRGVTARHPEGAAPDAAGTIMYADFTLEGQWFAAMDSAHSHGFGFNEAISLLVSCETQREMDAFSDALSAHPAAEQCGWLKDRFGVSWQISPTRMGALMSGTPEQTARVTQAFLTMKRFDLEALERAFSG